jgi:hypothetical protein
MQSSQALKGNAMSELQGSQGQLAARRGCHQEGNLLVQGVKV